MGKDREDEVKDANANRDKLEEEHEAAKLEGKAASSVAQEIKALKKQREHAQKEYEEQLQVKARAELALEEATEGAQGQAAQVESAKVDLKKVTSLITKKTSSLTKLEDAYKEKLDKEQKLAEDIGDKERRLQQLYAKQGRQEQFSSKAERDAALKSEVATSRKEHTSIKEQVKKESAAMESSVRKLADKEANIEEFKEKVVKLKEQGSAANETKELKKQRDAKTNERKKLWKEQHGLEQTVRMCQDTVQQADQRLNTMMNRGLREGLKSVKDLAAKHNVKGVHGPLIGLITCEETFARAVEVTAGNRLFNVVVDTDETAAQLLELMSKEGGGRVTFMPLNRLQNGKTKFPDTQKDAFPMTEKLEFDSQYQDAVDQIFGKTLICRNLDVAHKLAKSHDCDTITLDGDQCSKRGVFCGGSHEHKHLRITLQSEKDAKSVELQEAMQKQVKLQGDLTTLDGELNEIASQIQKLENSRHNRKNEIEEIQSDIKSGNNEVEQQRAMQVQKEAVRQKLIQSEQDLESQIQSLEEELKSPMTSGLDNKEQKERKALQERLPKMKEELVKVESQRAEEESKFQTVKVQLETNLIKQKEELEATIQQGEERESTGNDEDLSRCETELKSAEELVSSLGQQRDQVDKDVKAQMQVKQQHEKNMEVHRQTADKLSSQVDSEAKDLEKYISQRSALQNKATEANKKISQLGLLPADYQQYQSKTTKQIMKLLTTCQAELKKYSHVNKKALDQYMQFTEQCETLNGRREELVTGNKAIEDLIETLDHKKNEAILRTFKGVSRHFSNVFTELVPQGKAALVMKKRKDLEEDSQAGGAEASASKGGAVEAFGGVSVKVSFSGGDKQAQLMKALSGGQKSIVALALVFAIQRCDPVPFYLFDEIDAALDPVARGAVAAMIARQSDSGKEMRTQFITTTFRTELVQTADKHYQVTFKNKVSKVSPTTKAEALKCVNSS